MKRIPAVAATLVFVLVGLAGCSSTKSSTAASSSTSTASTSAAGATSTTAGGSGDPSAFCAQLAADTEKTAGFAASIGTPQQAAKLAEIKADNDAVLAAAPAEIHDAIASVYRVSELAQAALDGTLSAADKRAASAAASAAVATPEVKAAIASYKDWVGANCGSLSAKILSGGL